MRLSAGAALACAALAAPGPAPAAGDRCRIVGPVAVSSWFGFLESARQGNRDDTRAAAATLEAIVSLYVKMGCPAEALEGTFDCLSAEALSGELPGGPTAAAERCMAGADLPRP